MRVGTRTFGLVRGLPVIARPERRAIHTLLVEDEPDIAEVVQMALSDCNIDHHANGLSAVEVLGSGVRYELLILDLLLPGCPGIDVFFAARRAIPTLPVLVISGHATHVDITRILEHPRTKLLPKPFSLASLRENVRWICRQPPPAPAEHPRVSVP